MKRTVSQECDDLGSAAAGAGPPETPCYGKFLIKLSLSPPPTPSHPHPSTLLHTRRITAIKVGLVLEVIAWGVVLEVVGACESVYAHKNV
jgi:hypothetical protein